MQTVKTHGKSHRHISTITDVEFGDQHGDRLYFTHETFFHIFIVLFNIFLVGE